MIIYDLAGSGSPAGLPASPGSMICNSCTAAAPLGLRADHEDVVQNAGFVTLVGHLGQFLGGDDGVRNLVGAGWRCYHINNHMPQMTHLCPGNRMKSPFLEVRCSRTTCFKLMSGRAAADI